VINGPVHKSSLFICEKEPKSTTRVYHQDDNGTHQFNTNNLASDFQRIRDPSLSPAIMSSKNKRKPRVLFSQVIFHIFFRLLWTMDIKKMKKFA